MGRFDNKKTLGSKDIAKLDRARRSYEHMEIISTRDADGEKKQYVVIDLPSFRAYISDVERMLDLIDSLTDKHGPALKSTDS